MLRTGVKLSSLVQNSQSITPPRQRRFLPHHQIQQPQQQQQGAPLLLTNTTTITNATATTSTTHGATFNNPGSLHPPHLYTTPHHNALSVQRDLAFLMKQRQLQEQLPPNVMCPQQQQHRHRQQRASLHTKVLSQTRVKSSKSSLNLQHQQDKQQHKQQHRKFSTNPFQQGDVFKANYPQARTKPRPREQYEQELKDPNGMYERSRFLKDYGDQKNMWGHDISRTAELPDSTLEALSNSPVGRWMKRPDKMERALKEIRKLKKQKRARDRVNLTNWKKQRLDIGTSMAVFATVMTFATDSDMGFQLIASLGVLVGIIMIGVPILTFVAIAAYFVMLWQNRRIRENYKMLLAVYAGEDENGKTPEVSGEVDPTLSEEEQEKANYKYFAQKLKDEPDIDALKYKRYLLENQKKQIELIRKEGPKGMLDYMVERLQIEQEQLTLDRGVVMIEVRRLEDLIKKNIKRYKRCMKRLRPGTVLKHYEEIIEEQRTDLAAFNEELRVIDDRGWELKGRIDVLDQQLHNAVYSNINGIDHPVVRDIISNDLVEVLFGHIPSDLLNQQLVQDNAQRLAALQHNLRHGGVDLEQLHQEMEHQLTEFYPDNAITFNTTLPLLSKASFQNVDKRFPKGIQFVMDPLVDEGPQTQKLIEVAVSDFTKNFQQQYSWLDDYSAVTKQADGTMVDKDGKVLSDIDMHRLEDKMRFKALEVQQRKEEIIAERHARHIRYIQSQQDFTSHHRKLGTLGRDTLEDVKAKHKTVMHVPGSGDRTKEGQRVKKQVFTEDGSLVPSFDEEVQTERERLERQMARERESLEQAKLLNLKKQDFIDTSSHDPRLLHQLETERLAFGDKIVLREEVEQGELEKMWGIMESFGLQAPSEEERIAKRTEIKSQPKFWAGTMFQDKVVEDKPDVVIPHAGLNLLYQFFKPPKEDVVEEYLSTARRESQLLDRVLGESGSTAEQSKKEKQRLRNEQEFQQKVSSSFPEFTDTISPGQYDETRAVNDVAFTYNVDKIREQQFKEFEQQQRAEKERRQARQGFFTNTFERAIEIFSPTPREAFEAQQRAEQLKKQQELEALKQPKSNTGDGKSEEGANSWSLDFQDFEKANNAVPSKYKNATNGMAMNQVQHQRTVDLSQAPQLDMLESLKTRRRVVSTTDQKRRELDAAYAYQESDQKIKDELLEVVKKPMRDKIYGMFGTDEQEIKQLQQEHAEERRNAYKQRRMDEAERKQLEAEAIDRAVKKEQEQLFERNNKKILSDDQFAELLKSNNKSSRGW